MACETVPVKFFVEVEFDGSATPSKFGTVTTREQAEQLLLVLAGREDVTKATVKWEAVS